MSRSKINFIFAALSKTVFKKAMNPKKFMAILMLSLLGISCGVNDEEVDDLSGNEMAGKGDTATFDRTFTKTEATAFSPINEIEINEDGVPQLISVTAKLDTNASVITFNLKHGNNLICTGKEINGTNIADNVYSFTFLCEKPAKDVMKGKWTLNIGQLYMRTITQKLWSPPTLKASLREWTMSIRAESAIEGNPFQISAEAFSARQDFYRATQNKSDTVNITTPGDVIVDGQEWNCRILEAKTGSNSTSTIYVRFYPPQDPQQNLVLKAKTFWSETVSSRAPDSHEFQIVDGFLMGMVDSNKKKRVFLKGKDAKTPIFEDMLIQNQAGSPPSLVDDTKSVAAYGFCSQINAQPKYQTVGAGGSASARKECRNLAKSPYGNHYFYGCDESFDENPECRDSTIREAKDKANNACNSARSGKRNPTNCSVSLNPPWDTDCNGNLDASCQDLANRFNVTLSCGPKYMNATAHWSFNHEVQVD